ncbi:MAG: hypothetical protein GY760_23125 [Deltaproteobacteria bacterium]|nr:hypothetical protein [Deltaproteobacteria bacterium]
MQIDELKNWVKEHNIESRTKTYFLEWMENYKIEEPDEYLEVMKDLKVDDFFFELHTISLNLGNWPECDCNTVSASMRAFFIEEQILN